MIFALLVIFLCPQAWAEWEEDLGKVVITATRIGQHDYKVTGDVTVIDREQIEASNARTLPDVLQDALGIHISNNSTSKTSKLDIRGFGETAISNVLFLVNDRKTNSIDMSGADLIQIPLESVERIEIIRGAGSVLYGDNAVGGVVNIITKKGAGAMTGQVGSSYGSYDRRASDVELSGEKNHVSYYVYAQDADERGYRQNSDIDARDFNTRLGYVFSEFLELDLEAGWHEDKYGQPGSLTAAQIEADGRRASMNESDTAWTRDRFINFSFDVNPWPEDMYFGELVVDFSYRNRDSYTDNVAWSSDTKNAIDTVGINAKYIFDRTIMDHEVNFVTGIDYYDHENDIIRESMSTTELTILKAECGIYGFLEYELFPQVFINGGTRYHRADYNFNQMDGSDDLSQEPDEWVSMGGIKYEYAKGANIFLDIQQTFRFLATDEWFNSITGVLNTDLEQQTGVQYELGVKHRFENQTIVSATAYMIDIENEIYYNPTGGLFGWGANENYDKTRRVGVELGSRFNLLEFVGVEPLDKWEFYANYTYQNPRFKKGDYDGKYIPLVPRHQANTGMIVRFLDHFRVSLSGRYVGSQYAGSDTSNALPVVKPYFVLDGRVSYDKDPLEIYAEVNNITEEKYATYVSSYLTTKYIYPAPETNFNVGLNLKF